MALESNLVHESGEAGESQREKIVCYTIISNGRKKT